MLLSVRSITVIMLCCQTGGPTTEWVYKKVGLQSRLVFPKDACKSFHNSVIVRSPVPRG